MIDYEVTYTCRVPNSYSTAHSQLDKHAHATRVWLGVHVRDKYATPMRVACCARIHARMIVRGRAHSRVRTHGSAGARA